MATIKQAYTASVTVTTATLESLGIGATGVSSEIDNATTLKHLAMDLKLALADNGAGTGTVDFYLMRANGTGEYGDTADLALHQSLGSIDPSNTTPVKTIRVEQLPKFWKILYVNNNSVALTTGNTISYVGIDLTNA